MHNDNLMKTVILDIWSSTQLGTFHLVFLKGVKGKWGAQGVLFYKLTFISEMSTQLCRCSSGAEDLPGLYVALHSICLI